MESLSRVKRKEGYLVKKGHVRHNWKTRWFVLYDERLCYYKKNEDLEPAGYVLLYGCFIVSPCTEYTKKESVFRLTSREGTEYLIQAVNDEERDSWANSIGEVIRKLEAKDRKSQLAVESSRSSVCHQNEPVDFNSSSRLWDIIDAMQDPNAGVPLDNHYCKPDNKTYKLCFTGVQMIDWLLKWSFIADRFEGVGLCNVLLEKAHLQPVGITSKSSFKRKGPRSHGAFLDESDALYRFSALHVNSNRDALGLESSDESSDSDEETTTGKTPSETIRGTIVKQGFLEKKGHLRHNWKTRKFILCTDPPVFYYCKPSKGNLPVGKIKLEKCEVKLLSKDEDLFDVQDCSSDSNKQAKKYPILLRTRKGVKYVVRAASEMDRLDWIENLQSVCDDTVLD